VDDATQAYSYLLGQSPRAAERFLDEVERVAHLLAAFPELGRPRGEIGKGVRSIRLRAFGHLVFYRIDGETLMLLRLLHGARRSAGERLE